VPSAPQAPESSRPSSRDRTEAEEAQQHPSRQQSPRSSHGSSSSHESLNSIKDVEQQLTQSVDPESPPLKNRPQQSSTRPPDLQTQPSPLKRASRSQQGYSQYFSGVIHFSNPPSPAAAAADTVEDSREDEDVHMGDDSQDLDVGYSPINGHAQETESTESLASQHQQRDGRGLFSGPVHSMTLAPPNHNYHHHHIHREPEQQSSSGGNEQTATASMVGSEYCGGNGYSNSLQPRTQASCSSQSSVDGS
jgi:hypothetical protein